MTEPASPTFGAEVPQSAAEDSPYRHATLRKKGSIKQPGSKRSAPATTGSSNVSPTSNHGDDIKNDVTRSPLYCPVPTNADPTIVLVMRFQGMLVIKRANSSLEEYSQGVYQLFQVGVVN
jgi:hypothetical protein